MPRTLGGGCEIPSFSARWRLRDANSSSSLDISNFDAEVKEQLSHHTWKSRALLTGVQGRYSISVSFSMSPSIVSVSKNRGFS